MAAEFFGECGVQQQVLRAELAGLHQERLRVEERLVSLRAHLSELEEAARQRDSINSNNVLALLRAHFADAADARRRAVDAEHHAAELRQTLRSRDAEIAQLRLQTRIRGGSFERSVSAGG
eukprot:gene4398-14636_t